MLVESSTPVLDNVYVHEDDTGNLEHLLPESSTFVEIVRCSFLVFRIEKGIKQEIIAAIVEFPVISYSPLQNC